MSERDTTRLVAWSQEMRRMHNRLREALALLRGSHDPAVLDDLLLYCHGFCAALDGHHRAEDSFLFPAIAAAHPGLRPVLQSLSQDHSTIAHLIGGLRAAVSRGSGAEEIDRHLEGIAAIMENHFRYEERELLTVLDTVELDAAPDEVLGPL